MKAEKLHIGCSAYANPLWKTVFYPEDLPKKDWFEFYCRHFSTYEFNSSFYKFPTAENLLKWYDRTPGDFKFSIKMPKTMTHIKRLKNCEEDIAKFYAVCKEGLKDKLGCILWQFPPGFDFDREKLESIIHAVDHNFNNAIEFRNESWWRAEVEKEFDDNDLIFCNVNYPGLPAGILRTSPVGYVRMHGNPELFYSQYTKEEIETLYKKITSGSFKEIYVYFNNTASTAGIVNALEFRELLNNPIES